MLLMLCVQISAVSAAESRHLVRQVSRVHFATLLLSCLCVHPCVHRVPIETIPVTLCYILCECRLSGSVAEWLACWTQAQKAWVQIAVATLSGNSLRQTVHTHCASVHQAAKLLAALLRVVEGTAGLAESNGSLPPGL